MQDSAKSGSLVRGQHVNFVQDIATMLLGSAFLLLVSVLHDSVPEIHLLGVVFRGTKASLHMIVWLENHSPRCCDS